MNLLALAKLLYVALKGADAAVDHAFPRRIAEIIKLHAKGAAVASVVSGWIPGVGAVAAVIVAAGFIWTMYGRINVECKLPFAENIVKSVASGVATNLGAALVSDLVIGGILGFIPGIGNIGAAVLLGGTSYALTLVSGGIYLKLLTTLIQDGVDPTTVPEAELRARAARVTAETDVKSALKNPKDEYKPE